MDTISFKTQSASEKIVKRDWYVIDATDLVLGRLASQVAHKLMGKNKPYYTPSFDCGDYVIVINSEKIQLTGNKWDAKSYIRHTGYPGGQREVKARALNAKKPNDLIEIAVKGMLPKTKLGRAMFKKLFVYAGNEHPHAAQKPQSFNI
ncbi:MAG: 50S ribosomal protein L13 [Chitinophagales bacterium]|nr:50S ribosomal protein L13 [Chitinophagales bacterium]